MQRMRAGMTRGGARCAENEGRDDWRWCKVCRE